MRYRSKVNRSLILIILFLCFCDVIFRIVKASYYNSVVSQNQEKIDEAISQLKYKQNTVEEDKALLLPLLEFKNLTDSQNGQLYLLITTLNYTSGDMKSYFDTVGKALFYNEHCNNIDETIYLYANMAKYFLEIGAETEAYSIIRRAKEFGSFYDCKNILARLQILQVYADYLISEGRYDEAYIAADQIIEDSSKTASFSPDFPSLYERSGEAIKAMILLAQQKYYGAYNLACELLERYHNENEVLSQFSAFDFYMPLTYIKAMWALNTQKYDKAVEFLGEYGQYCEKFFFTMKKIRLTQRIVAAIPSSMGREKDTLSKQLSADSKSILMSVIKDYTYLASEKFSTIMTQMDLESEVHAKTQKYLHTISFNLFITLVILLLLYAVFNEAQTDGLTRLYNRRALNAKIRNYEFRKTNYSAIMLDLDDFKHINDTYGHAFGDEVLKAVAGVVLDAERRHIKAYRYGGEEIVLLFEHMAFEDVIRMAESIRTKICRLKFSKDVKITASFGVGAKPENPIKLADENLYYAKRKGKNIVAYKVNNKQYLAERRLEIRNPMPDTVQKDK